MSATSPSHSPPKLIDADVRDRVLVYGSPPPEGRDLDLLVRPSERRVIEGRLRRAGYLERDGVWAHFQQCSVDIVELTDAESWGLAPDAVDDLFAEAVSVEGLTWLVRPSAHHTLLILARQLAADGTLNSKRRARLAAAARLPGAWDHARARAAAWTATAALAALAEVHEGGAASAAALTAARRERRRRRMHKSTLPERAAFVRDRARARAPRRPGRVVAVSGLDGCGKSTQAAALCGTLQRLGYDAVVVRTRISWETWLWELVFSVKRLTRALAVTSARRPRSVAGDSGSESGRREDPGDDFLRRLRQRSASLTDVWAAVITLTNAWSQWRLMGGAVARGAIVISDRYTLDSIVELRYAYGEQLPLVVCRRLLFWLYPRPTRAYLLDVAPVTALTRKGEWGEPWLTRHRALYLQEAPNLGVTVLDGERPQADLCAEIARAVWSSDRL